MNDREPDLDVRNYLILWDTFPDGPEPDRYRRACARLDLLLEVEVHHNLARASDGGAFDVWVQT
jgi:hypothetical protein